MRWARWGALFVLIALLLTGVPAEEPHTRSLAPVTFDGSRSWLTRRLGFSGPNAVTQMGATIILQGYGNVASLDARSGKLLWRIEAPDATAHSHPYIDVVGFGGKLAFISCAAGQGAIRARNAGEVTQAIARLRDDATAKAVLLAVDASSGRVVWPPILLFPDRSKPSPWLRAGVVDRTAFFYTEKGNLEAFDLKTGAPQSAKQTELDEKGLVEVGGRVYRDGKELTHVGGLDGFCAEVGTWRLIWGSHLLYEFDTVDTYDFNWGVESGILLFPKAMANPSRDVDLWRGKFVVGQSNFDRGRDFNDPFGVTPNGKVLVTYLPIETRPDVQGLSPDPLPSQVFEIDANGCRTQLPILLEPDGFLPTSTNKGIYFAHNGKIWRYSQGKPASAVLNLRKGDRAFVISAGILVVHSASGGSSSVQLIPQ